LRERERTAQASTHANEAGVTNQIDEERAIERTKKQWTKWNRTKRAIEMNEASPHR